MPRRRVVLVVNASRPAVAAAVAAATRHLAEPTLTVAMSRTLDEARHLVYQHAPSAEVFVFAGGDGTFTMGLSLLAEARRGRSHPAVGVAPLGTGNAMAHAFSIPVGERGVREQLARALDANAPLRSFRPLQVAGMRAPFCGFGVDARLVRDQAETAAALRRWGPVGRAIERRAGYAISIAARSLPAMLLGDRPRVAVTSGGAADRLDDKGNAIAQVAPGELMWEGPCTMSAAATIPCFGFGLRMFQFARLRPDRFHVRASDASLAEIVRNTRAAFAGRYTSPQVHDFLADSVQMAVSEPAPFEAGGEPLGLLEKVEVTLGPEIPLVAP